MTVELQPIVLAISALVAFVLLAVLVALALGWMRARRGHAALEQRFKPILDVEGEIEQLRAEAHRTITQALTDATAALEKLRSETAQAETQLATLRTDYKDKRATYERLAAEVAIFDERLAFAEMGVYEPHFDFTDSEAYKAEILKVRGLQKELVAAGTAVVCPIEWSVDGSKAKGRTMTNRNIRLTLRAFNNECDAAIANARWNNVNAMEKRIERASEQIDKLNESNKIFIGSEYAKLKLRELYLTHEHRERAKQEREERSEAARLAREEQKLLRDLERAQDEEARYERLLAKARAEAASFQGQKLEAFEAQIQVLERDLAEAHAKAERAQAMAERTRSGYVYIISNVGSFGADVVKIGLTRRLDPNDRVRELGDASVPFFFDTHAIIYSDDAPALERALHAEFNQGRINTENSRKEFFRVPSIDDVEAAVKRLAPASAFFRDVEAQEYRETLARRNAALSTAKEATPSVFPAEL